METQQAKISPDGMDGLVVDLNMRNQRYDDKGGYGTHYEYALPGSDPLPLSIVEQLAGCGELDDIPIA